MDTLPQDLHTIISNHFDVLPTVFLTDNPIELEDADESVYCQENWPWILYDLKDIDGYIFIEALKHNDNLGILKYLDELISKCDSRVIDLIYIYAHKYGRRDIIEKLTNMIEDEIECIHYGVYYATWGGHVELLEDRIAEIRNIDVRNEFFDRVCQYAYTGGHKQILENNNIRTWLNWSMQDAIIGAIAGNQLELLKELIELNNGIAGLDEDQIDVGPETYDTLRYLLENNILKINKLFGLLMRKMIVNKSPVELFEWFAFEYMDVKHFEVYQDDIVILCINVNRLQYIRRLIPTWCSTLEQQIGYLINEYKLIIQPEKLEEDGCRQVPYILRKLK